MISWWLHKLKPFVYLLCKVAVIWQIIMIVICKSNITGSLIKLISRLTWETCCLEISHTKYIFFHCNHKKNCYIPLIPFRLQFFYNRRGSALGQTISTYLSHVVHKNWWRNHYLLSTKNLVENPLNEIGYVYIWWQADLICLYVVYFENVFVLVSNIKEKLNSSRK